MMKGRPSKTMLEQRTHEPALLHKGHHRPGTLIAVCWCERE